jgi:tetratricopeptide (TPR) repeat protein
MNKKFMSLFRGPSTPDAEHSVAAGIQQARDMHQRGELDAAGRLYEGLIDADPGDAEVCYRFGNLLKDQGDLVRALEMYDRAILMKPSHSHAYCNRAVVLGLLNRSTDALDSYDRAIEIDPTDSIALCNRAMLLIGLGHAEPALASFDAALRNDPNCFAALFGRGAIFQESKHWSDAFNAYQQAITLNPRDAAAHYNLAVVATELKRWDSAIASTEAAIGLNADFASAYAKRAEILQELQQYAAALASYDRAIALNPADPNSLNNRGVLRQLMGDFNAALGDHEKAVALNPNSPEAWFNRGAALKELDDPNGALASYERALELRPDYAVAYVNRGTALQDQGFIREAVASYQTAIALDADLPEAHYNLALASLTLGDYATGWREYEWRWRAKGGPIYRERREFSKPLWLGSEAIAGKTILVYAEQGLGDALQFARYTELVAQLGARLILEVPAPLVTLFETLKGVAQVIAYRSPLPHFEFQCPMMSLPLVFKTTLETIPFADGYLKSDADKLSEWRQRLGPKNKPRVGLTWSGNQAAGTNRKRHFALSLLIPHLSDTCDYFCLQTDVVAADQEFLDNSRILQFQSLLRDFSDTAALCECMDLMISVDTSVAHLACALGKQTWVLLTYAADWRWLLDRDSSPWYSSARLFRQKSSNAWDTVFKEVAENLRTDFASSFSVAGEPPANCRSPP